MKKTHLLLMLALCATLLASCSAGEPDVTQTQPVPSISPTNTPDENTVLPGLDDDIILPDGGRNDSTTREATGVTSMDKARRVIEQLEEELERLSEVKEAHVIIAGHKAAVALTFDDQYKAGIDDRFRKIVRERIDGVIGGIDTVALTTDKTVMDALEALQDRLDSVSDVVPASGAGQDSRNDERREPCQSITRRSSRPERSVPFPCGMQSRKRHVSF